MNASTPTTVAGERTPDGGCRTIDATALKADLVRRRLLAAAGAAAVVAGFAGRRARAAPAAATVHTVRIDAFAFQPPVVTVDLGDTIRWRNDDPVPHTVTAKGGFDSGAIAAGGTWSYTATQRGRFAYICSFHPTMKGTLIVR
ncbi:MAG: cupredoxin family copper-binding protein [Betaproteobacteria bacterium]|nr:cupredoxin family copper-binding protein [Betaproteobacteria bacterium]MDE2004432.1 cupredoxin family copper-binding protein [Betaproteobacteria bacterium]MDE2209217.1 cupredoxin family copper-binding protein [Betaproteobacteria bacterium]